MEKGTKKKRREGCEGFELIINKTIKSNIRFWKWKKDGKNKTLINSR